MSNSNPRVSGEAAEAPFVHYYVSEPGREELLFSDRNGLTRQYRRLDPNGYPVPDSFTVTSVDSWQTGWHYDLATTGKLPCSFRTYRISDPDRWHAVRDRCAPGEFSDFFVPPRNIVFAGAALAINRRFADYGSDLAAHYATEIFFPSGDEPPFELRSDRVVHRIDPETGRTTTSRFQYYSRVLADYPANHIESLSVDDQNADGTPDHIMAIRSHGGANAERYFEVSGRNTQARRGMLDLFQPLLADNPEESDYFSFAPAELVYFDSGEQVRRGDPLFDLLVGGHLVVIRADRGGRVLIGRDEFAPGRVNVTIRQDENYDFLF